MIDRGFRRYQFGYGSAVAVILFVISFVFSLLYQRFVLRRDTEGALTGMVGDCHVRSRRPLAPRRGSTAVGAALRRRSSGVVVPLLYVVLGGFRTTGRSTTTRRDCRTLDARTTATSCRPATFWRAAAQQRGDRRDRDGAGGGLGRVAAFALSRYRVSRAARRCTRSSRWGCCSRSAWRSCRCTS